MAIVGPGSIIEDQIAPSATLDGASEYEYVTILNPLTDDFAIQVAQSRPVDLPMSIRNRDGGLTHSERDVTQVYGIGLRNPDFASRKHILNKTIIRSGKTINLRGDDAQVAVRQLTNEIIQREGNTLHQADPNVRKEVEGRIIIARGSVEDLMDNRLQSTTSVINQAINKSNEVNDEGTFANLNTGTVAAEEGTTNTASVPSGSNDFNTPRPSKTAKK
jgi:hypothetical protein